MQAKTRNQPEYNSCPWCGTRNVWGTFECRRCGGPQPAVETSDAGPAPPAPPRAVPAGYGRRLFLTQPVGLVGAIFTLVGLPFACIFSAVAISSGDWTFLLIGGSLGIFFVGLGVIMTIAGLRIVQQKIRTYRTGLAARGAVIDVSPDYSITVNGRHPWRATYTYKVMGVGYSGTAHAWHPVIESGSPVHVLYLPNKPDVSAVYPPLGASRP